MFRELKHSDLSWFIELRNSVREMLHNPSMFNLQDGMKWFPTSKTSYWVIELNGQRVGYFRITDTDVNQVMIGADIDPLFQGKGIASTVYPIFVQEVLIPRGVSNLELRVLKKNEIAIRFYKKLGFVIDDQTSIDFHMSIKVNQLKSRDD
jgi:RimJ/RimL family protein N-acetyltransferase